MEKRSRNALLLIICGLCLTAALLSLPNSRRISLPEPHREDFSPHIPPADMTVLGGDPEIKKLWYLLPENWFLSPDLTDFSQAVTTQPLYYVPKEMGYTICSIDEDGQPTQGTTATVSSADMVPSGLFALTYAMIETDLSGIEYQDYIITYAPHLYTVIIWVRCADEDRFLTYPERPEFYGAEVGTVYTLPELKATFAAAYEANGSR